MPRFATPMVHGVTEIKAMATDYNERKDAYTVLTLVFDGDASQMLSIFFEGKSVAAHKMAQGINEAAIFDDDEIPF